MSKKLGIKAAGDRLDVTAESSIKMSQAVPGNFSDISEKIERAPAEVKTGTDAEEVSLTYKAGVDYPINSIVKVPLEQVDENPLNPRVFFQEDDLSSLAISIETRGQLESAKAYFNRETGRFMLKNGHRRFRALQALNIPYIRVEVVAQGDELDEFCDARDINLEAKGHSFLDDSVRFVELMKKYEINQRTLSIKLKMAEGEVSRRIKIGQILPREIIEFIAHCGADIGPSACYRIANLYEQGLMEDSSEANRERLDAAVYFIIQEFMDGRCSVRKLQGISRLLDVTDPASSETAKSTPKRASVIRRVKLAPVGTNSSIGSFRVFPDKLQLEISGMSQTERDLFSEKLLEFLEQNELVKPS